MSDEPEIAWISGSENRRQGNGLQQFYSNNGAGDTWPAGCGITPDVPSAWFLAIPLHKGIPLNTTWACKTAVALESNRWHGC